ncbi:hypothetical protein HK101_002038, partial [Irineochytrium annulatum]
MHDSPIHPSPTAVPPEAAFRIKKLLQLHPSLTITQVINACNHLEDVMEGKVDPTAEPVIPGEADVVVAGAGIAGLMYAIHLK